MSDLFARLRLRVRHTSPTAVGPARSTRGHNKQPAEMSLRVPRRSWFVAVAALCACACTAPTPPQLWTDPEPWSIRFSEETRVLRHEPVAPDSSARQMIELVDELVIGGDEDEYAFHALFPRVVANQRGQIFVMDGGNRRIQVYGRDGHYIQTIGRSGKGPGEFGNAASIAIAGGQLATLELYTRYLSLFSTQGIYQKRVSVPNHTFRIVGDAPDYVVLHTVLPDHTVLSVVSDKDGPGEPEARDLLVIENGRRPTYPLGGRRLPLRSLSQFVELTEAHGNVFYVAGTEGYEVAAFTADRELAWLLRLAWPRLPLREQDSRYVLEVLVGAGLPVGPRDVEWPSHLPALAWIRSDGHGRLYVFPAIEARREPVDDISKLRPVDVYDSDGNLLVSGLIKLGRWEWQSAVGDLVYGTRLDPATGEWQIVRQRLILP